MGNGDRREDLSSRKRPLKENSFSAGGTTRHRSMGETKKGRPSERRGTKTSPRGVILGRCGRIKCGSLGKESKRYQNAMREETKMSRKKKMISVGAKGGFKRLSEGKNKTQAPCLKWKQGQV